MKYCPKCGAEYIASVDTCADCGVALVDTPMQPSGEQADGADLKFITAHEPSNRVELELIKAALDQAGIPYRLADAEVSSSLLSMTIGTISIKVQVAEDQLERARRLIEDELAAEPLDEDSEIEGVTDEPVSRYCAECKLDYRIAIDRCQICGAELADEQPEEEIQEAVAWEPVSKIVLEIVGQELEQAGIPFSAVDLTPAGDYAGEPATAPQIQISVPPDRLEEARDIIRGAADKAELPDDFDPGPEQQ